MEGAGGVGWTFPAAVPGLCSGEGFRPPREFHVREQESESAFDGLEAWPSCLVERGVTDGCSGLEEGIVWGFGFRRGFLGGAGKDLRCFMIFGRRDSSLSESRV